MNVAQELAPLLKQGEVILWQGRPNYSFTPGVGAFFPVVFGLGYAAIAGYEHIGDGLNVFRVMMDVRDGLH